MMVGCDGDGWMCWPWLDGVVVVWMCPWVDVVVGSMGWGLVGCIGCWLDVVVDVCVWWRLFWSYDGLKWMSAGNGSKDSFCWWKCYVTAGFECNDWWKNIFWHKFSYQNTNWARSDSDSELIKLLVSMPGIFALAWQQQKQQQYYDCPAPPYVNAQNGAYHH